MLLCLSLKTNGSIAQLGEHLPYKQRVIGSSPIVPTKRHRLLLVPFTFDITSSFIFNLTITCSNSLLFRFFTTMTKSKLTSLPVPIITDTGGFHFNYIKRTYLLIFSIDSIMYFCFLNIRLTNIERYLIIIVNIANTPKKDPVITSIIVVKPGTGWPRANTRIV